MVESSYRARAVCCAVLALMGLSSSTLWAQDERVRVSGNTSLAVGDGGSALAVGAEAAFQVAPHAGFQLEALYIPDQDFDRDRIALPAIFPTPLVDNDGRTVAFLTSFVTDLQAGRLRPYALFGGGIANVRRNLTIVYPPGILTGATYVSSIGGVGVAPVDVRLIPMPRTITSRISENDLALTAGTGLDVRVWKRLSVAADVRYMRLFQTTRDAGGLENITRIGARTSWWF